MQVVECDGTNVNKSLMAGVIRRLEEPFHHPLQWLVCLLMPMSYFYDIYLKLLMELFQAHKGFRGRLKNGLRHAPSNHLPPLKQ